jgi:hypothetical protein
MSGVQRAPKEGSGEPQSITTAPLHTLSREDQNLVINSTIGSAEEALDRFHLRASLGLLKTQQQKDEQKLALDAIHESLLKLEERTLKWVAQPEDDDWETTDERARQPKTIAGTRKKKFRAMEKLTMVRKTLAQTTQLLGQPPDPSIKAPSSISAFQNNNYFGGATEQPPDPAADFHSYQANKK